MEYIILKDLYVNHARHVFDTYDDFSTWLNRYNYFFDGEKPINADIEFIKQRLIGMQYGDNI